MTRYRPEFTSDCRRIYPLTTDREEQAYHARRLRAGLAALPAEYMAAICGGCEGTGAPKWKASPSYACPICNGTGLLQGWIEAPPSVLNQVLAAADRSART